MRYIPYQQPQQYGYGGMQQYSSYNNPPTIGSIGGYGYNNGMYFNPFYIRQQEEAQKRYNEWNRNNQTSIWAKLGNCVNNCLGYDYYNPSQSQLIEQMNQDYQVYLQTVEDNKLASSCASIVDKSIATINRESANEAAIQRKKQEYEDNLKNNPPKEPDGESLFNWLRNEGSERYREALNNSLKRQQRNTAQLYDRNGYHQLLQAHTSAFNSLNPNVTIDDMEIGINLPMRLAQEREARRREFINQISRG